MSDDLRTRIAAVVDDFYIYDPCWRPNDWKVAVADAVIEELNSSLIGYQIWNAAEWISVNSGCVPYEIYRSVGGIGGGWSITVQRIEADDD
jgi:hypothetical protein